MAVSNVSIRLLVHHNGCAAMRCPSRYTSMHAQRTLQVLPGDWSTAALRL